MSDASYVLESLDATNKKALYRRAHAFKTQERYEEAARDLQALIKHHGEDKEMKDELSLCMKKMLEQKKRAEEEAKKPKPKI